MNVSQGKRKTLWLTLALSVFFGALVALPGIIRRAPVDLLPTPPPKASAPAPTPQAPSEVGVTPAPLDPESLPDPTWEPGAEGPARDLNAMDCLIEPYELVDIGSSVAGVIEHLRVERGDMVKAGDVVVELESRLEVAAVELARAHARMDSGVRSSAAQLQLREKRRERGGKLFKHKVVSLDERDEIATEADLARLELYEALEEKRLAELELDRAVATLERRTIRSPVSGVVVSRLMSPGEVPHDDTILRIAQIDPLRVDVILPAAMFGSIKVGTRAAVVPELPGDEVRVAAVTIVDRVIDAASGTFGVQLELSNSDLSTPGGLHCQVRFDVE